ncbi:carboxylate--amine ligase [Streptomyces cinnamoneus]|uniref:Putative glutamate--cysteine ligase 2 n=1 Tax=Streptomyces cinnamoneus TaxID=53446 RepID=A0A2G1XL30_STRCJ|nr:glutamate--cysteine ligase [Streptomyces cinnamoneus]PHQ51926.1 carboxylate--amine ligase [Streptomyces cinnamoneus]PPT11629.1 glutamate--cysteine ligase [Streptomyces cinnamoneus]
MRSVGVEEEFLLVDPESGAPQAVAETVLAQAEDAHGLEKELQQEQLEVATRPTTTMDELSAEIRARRGAASEQARAAGVAIAALATSPLPVDPSLSAGRRYRRVANEFGLTAQEQLTCGCHVHVGVDSDEEGVAVLDRIRPWLATLTALSANSPFWQGHESGYSSYRSLVWGRWPSAGPVETFGSPERYHAQVTAMLATDTLLDEGMLYFDARLSHRYPTVEVRVADVCLDVADAVLVAALARALVETEARAWRAGEPPSPATVGVLRLASWRAAKSGVQGQLVHPLTWKPKPAEAVCEVLVEHVREALADTGDLAMVQQAMGDLLERGGGAGTQREILAGTGDLRSVVAHAAARTLAPEGDVKG